MLDLSGYRVSYRSSYCSCFISLTGTTLLLHTAVSAEEFERYFEHLSTLAYADTPDYAHLKALFRDLFLKLGYKYESVLFDWEVIKHQQEQQQQEQMDFRGLPAHQPQQHRQSGQQMRQVIRKAQR